jgi:Ca2+-binding EF-hand superfamily protein
MNIYQSKIRRRMHTMNNINYLEKNRMDLSESLTLLKWKLKEEDTDTELKLKIIEMFHIGADKDIPFKKLIRWIQDIIQLAKEIKRDE